MKRSLQIFVGFAISAALIYWMIVSLDWKVVAREFYNVSWWVFIPITVVIFAQFYFRALRWRYLLPEGSKSGIGLLFDGIFIGNLATYILPLRAGEFIRPLVLTSVAKTPFATGFTSIVIERFFDLAMVLISFALIAPYLTGLPDWVFNGAVILSILGFGIFVFIISAGLFAEQTKVVVTFFAKFAPKIIQKFALKITDELILGAKPLRSLKNLLIVTSLSVGVWLVTYLLFYLFLFISDSLPHSFFLGTTIAVIVALAVAAPSAPGFVGIYQAGCIAAFALFAVNKELASVYAIITHAYQFLFVVLAGSFSLIRNGLKFSELASKKTV